MSIPLSPLAATQTVVWGGLVLGLLLGALAQATRFCTMGALADWFSYGGSARLMMWLLAVAVAATGAMALAHFGLLDASHSLAWSPRFLWLSYLVGGSLFGVGMVFAAGCPQRNLVRAGAGSIKSLVTLLVAGLFAQMTLRGILAQPRVALLDNAGLTLATPQDLGSLLASLLGQNGDAMRWLVLAGLLAAAVYLLWKNRHGMDRLHWSGGLGLGLLVIAGWYLTGYLGYLPEHPETLEPAWLGTYSHRPEALSFSAPLAQTLDLLTLWSDHETTLSYGITVCLGTLLGSAAMAFARGEFRLETFHDTRDTAYTLLGAALMGFGGVCALGCSIGQGVSGLSLLSAGACLAVTGIVAGARAALWIQSRQLD